MNPITTEQLPPPPQPPQPNRKSTSCDRHPDEQFTGFCPCCLCERLSVLDKSSASSSTAATGRKSGIKSLFKSSNNDGGPALRGKPSSSSFLPELRRTKSFSVGKNEGGFLGFSGVFEPQRKSCDVRGRSTLFSLFNQDDVKRNGNGTAQVQVQAQHTHVGINDRPCTSNDLIEEVGDHVVEDVGCDEIQVLEDEIVVEPIIKSTDQHEVEKVMDLKPMKYHIDLDSQNKKVGSRDLKELAGSFWSAASVFSKKLRAWTKKNSSNNHHHRKIKKNGSQTVEVSLKKKNGGRDTQSEIADYGFGRRSCDTDPRFSLDAGRFSVDATMAGRYSVDAGRFSFDDGRCSFDEPRASWDGYLMMGRTFPRMMLPMVSVVEDAPVTVSRKDAYIPVEEPRRSSVSVLSQMIADEPRRSSVSINGGDEPIPGGAAQTKDYYSDSSSRRRRSLDRSSSIRKTAAAVVAEMDEMKTGCDADANANANANVHPPAPPCVDYLNGTRVVSGDRYFRELDFHSNSNSNSLRDDYSESFDLGLRDNASVIGSNNNCERKGSKKSSRWRAWNIWGLIYRRGTSKDDDEDRETMPNGVERSYSESWQDLRREGGGGYGDPRAPGFNKNVLRSNSSVSWRNSYGSFGSIRKGAIESNGGGRKKKDGFVLERNRSGRYSPNHGGDNGMLRFYLTPMRGSRRASSGKSKAIYSHSFARSVLRMY